MREFYIRFSGNELSYGVLLSCWLLGSGVGSLAADRIKRERGTAAGWIHVILGLQALGLVGLRLSRFILGTLPGQTPGPGVMLGAALLLSILAAAPLGLVFVVFARRLGGDVPRVYLYESLGAAAGGGLVRFGLIPFLSNGHSFAVLAGALVLSTMGFKGRRRSPSWIVITGMALLLITAGDRPSQKWAWTPFHLIASKDTRYGQLQLIQEGEQFSLYSSGIKAFTFPDPAADEEAVHFAMLQNPAAAEILVLGSSGGGLLREILKYPARRIDLIEIDPETISFLVRRMPHSAARVFENTRVRILHGDGRAFLKETSESYDMILLNPGVPTDARINRFFTREFFQIVRSRLRDGGLVCFRSPGAETYLSPTRASSVASMHNTLRSVFSRLGIVPGPTYVFLAGDRPLVLDAGELERRIERLGLDTKYVASGFIFDRLDPLRVEQLRTRLKTAEGPVNLDHRPIGYLFNIMLWAAETSGPVSSLFRSLPDRPRPMCLELPLLILGGLMTILLGKKGRRSGSLLLLPLFVMGLTSILAEILVILSFQATHGSLYGELALLFSIFMLGLAAGAWTGRRRHGPCDREIRFLQAVLLLLMAVLRVGLEFDAPPVFHPLFLALLGIVNGWLFVSANTVYLETRDRLGRGYGLDLLGGCAGALVGTSLLIPLFGLAPVANLLLALNAMTWIYLTIGLRLSRPSHPA